MLHLLHILLLVLLFLPVATVRRGDQQNQNLWDELTKANAHLEARVQERTVELRSLGARLVRVQEEERRRLSRDLHDDLGQTLTGLRLRLTALCASIEGDEAALKHVQAALDAIDMGVDQVRGLAHDLRPSALDSLGLSDALEALATEWAAVSQLDLELALSSSSCSDEQAEVIFRVAQEGLTNVARHAYGQRVRLTLEQTDESTILLVEDDGQGVPAQPTNGLGLIGMRERLSQLGGTLTIETSDWGGVRLRAALPLDRGEPDD